jgi:hypothetical protein
MFSDLNGIKLGMNGRKRKGIFSNTWREVTNEISWQLKYFNPIKNENSTYQNLYCVGKAGLAAFLYH